MGSAKLRCIPILVLLFGCATSSPVEEPTIFSQLTGNWDTEDASTCESFRAISFSDDHKVMISTYSEIGYATETDAREQFIYDVLEVGESELRLELEEESRLDSEGNPVVWILRLVDENTFCWGRDDWRPGGCTPPRIRCEN